MYRLRPTVPREEIQKLWEGSFHSRKETRKDLFHLFLLEIKYFEQRALQQHREHTSQVWALFRWQWKLVPVSVSEGSWEFRGARMPKLACRWRNYSPWPQQRALIKHNHLCTASVCVHLVTVRRPERCICYQTRSIWTPRAEIRCYQAEEPLAMQVFSVLDDL